METVKNTKAGVLSWTPAPVCISPASSETSEEWDGGEEQDQDFYSQMDDNGIIGLIQERDDDTECIQVSPSPKSHTPEDVTTSGYEVQHMPPEEGVYSLNGHLEDVDGLSTFGDDVSTLNEQSHREDATNETKLSKEGQKTERFSEREKFFEMAPGKKDRAEGERGFRIEPAHHNKDESEIISERHFFQSSMVVEADGDCKPQCPSYQMSSRATAPMFSPLGHFTTDVAAAAPGLVGETVPDLVLTDSPPDSYSIFSCASSPERQRNQQLEEKAVSPQPIMVKEQSGVHHEYPQSGLKQPNTYSFMQRSQPGQDAALLNNTPKEDNTRRANQTRKCHPNHKVPDLSKVKPRVSFPKGDYQPPKSRWPSKNPPKSMSPEAPVVFKSPVDIVKDVLLNTTDGPHTPFDIYQKTLTGSPDANVPQEFRCQQETGILLDQLQEKHGLLLTKYAEAANTIDRLRLEPKVNLYSEQPKPAQVMPLQVQVEPSKFMQLDFPQAQKAQPSTLSPQPNEQTTAKRAAPSGLSLSASISKSAEWQGSQKVANYLYAKADKFLQKLQHFEDLLNNETPFHQVKSFAELGQVLRSLEKGYLSAKKKHKELQEQGAKHSQFDPNRELEEFIYQCGRHMDDLKEVVDRRARDADSASLCLQAPKISTSDDSHSESRHAPLLVHPVETPEKEVQIVHLSSSNSKKRCAEQAMDVKDGSTVCLTPTTHIMRKEVRKSYSSSQSSLAEISTSVKRSAKLQTGNGRVLSQDRGISPGTDSGFVGSEYSHHIWAGASCSFHQGASKCVRPAEASPKKPQGSRSSSRSRDSPQPHRRTPIQPAEYFQQTIRRLCPGERKSKQWARSQTDSTRTDSESANTASEDAQSDQCEENLPCSSPNSSSSALRHHHGDTPKAARSSQVVTCNDPSRLLRSIRPNGESPLNNCHSVPNSTQGNCNDHRTSHPLSGSRKKWTIGGEAEQVVRRITRKRLTHRHQAQAETSTATEDDHFARRILVSRSTQTSIVVAESQTSHTSVHVQHTKQDCVCSVTDNVGRTSSGPSGSPRVSHPNLSCESEQRHVIKAETAGGNQEPPHFASCRSHYCRHCGHSDTKTAHEQDCRGTSSPMLSSGQPTVSLSKAPPQPAMCPTPLLLYLQPHMCTNNTSAPPDLISSKKEERSQHLPCVVPQRSLDDSLLAAREMKDTSEKMVRSLNTALRSLERLSKSRSGFHAD
ncbi:uncharacterized protein akna isoform X2 [Stigmatopora argus]